MDKVPAYDDWLHANTNVFWSDIARSEHVVQFYNNDQVFCHTLSGFVQEAVHSNENAVVIATEPHLNGLEHRLHDNGLNIDELISNHQFIPLDVEDIIAEFMIDGQLDESRLHETLASLFIKAGYNKKRFRLCGEIAPTLLARGYTEIAKRVEHLTEMANRENHVCIYCAYPGSMFGANAMNIAKTICNEHSKILSGFEEQLPSILYKDNLENGC